MINKAVLFKYINDFLDSNIYTELEKYQVVSLIVKLVNREFYVGDE